MTTAAVDKGKLIIAKLPGDCAECGGTIVPGQFIYFSRQIGSRHRGCVERDEDRAGRQPAREAAPREAPRPSPRNERFLFGDGDGRDDTRVPRDAPPPRSEGGQPPANDDGAYRAPVRDTAFSRAGDRDAARRELASVLRLLIEALIKIERLLE